MHHHLISLSIGGFFLAGMVGSLHCLGMCAPLSSLFLSNSRSSFRALIFYHVARVFSYAGVGLVLSLIGKEIRDFISFPLVFYFLSLILGLYILGVPLKPPAVILNLEMRLLQYFKVESYSLRALLFGFFTPLLPCGLLYGVLATSLMAPTYWVAMAWMVSFALGTLPLLVLGQTGLKLVVKKFGLSSWVKRLLAALTLVLFWIFYFMHQHG